MDYTTTETRKTFTERLLKLLTPIMYTTFYDLWKSIENNPNFTHGTLYTHFSDELDGIKWWNKLKIHDEYNKVLNQISKESNTTSSKKVFDRMLEIIMKVETQILQSICMKFSSTKKMEIKIPTSEEFIHRCYINAAEEFKVFNYLFDDREDDNEMYDKKNKQIKKCYNVINTCIKNTLTDIFPIYDIIEYYDNLIDESEDGGGGEDEIQDCNDKDIEEDKIDDEIEDDSSYIDANLDIENKNIQEQENDIFKYNIPDEPEPPININIPSTSEHKNIEISPTINNNQYYGDGDPFFSDSE